MKSLYLSFSLLIFLSCTSGSEVEVYEKKGSKVFEKYIFELDDTYFFAETGDTAEIVKVGKNKVFANKDILFKRLTDLSARVNGPLWLEASNHVSGPGKPLNYDLKYVNKQLFVRVFHAGHRTSSYHVDLSQQYVNLLRKAVNNFAQKRGSHHRTLETENTVTFHIRLNGRNFRRSKSIRDDDVLLLYGALNFVLAQNLKHNDHYREIPDTLRVQTSEKYRSIRNLPD